MGGSLRLVTDCACWDCEVIRRYRVARGESVIDRARRSNSREEEDRIATPKAIDLFLLPFRYPNAATPMFLRWW